MDTIIFASTTTLPITPPIIATDGALWIPVRAVLVSCADTVVLHRSKVVKLRWSCIP